MQGWAKSKHLNRSNTFSWHGLTTGMPGTLPFGGPFVCTISYHLMPCVFYALSSDVLRSAFNSPPLIVLYPFSHLSNRQRANRSNQVEYLHSIQLDITHTSRLERAADGCSIPLPGQAADHSTPAAQPANGSATVHYTTATSYSMYHLLSILTSTAATESFNLIQ